MPGKESLCAPQTIEGVFKKRDIKLLDFILPQEMFEVEVVKKEGESVEVSGKQTKVPEGYSYVRILTEEGSLPRSWLKPAEIKEKSASAATLVPGEHFFVAYDEKGEFRPRHSRSSYNNYNRYKNYKTKAEVKESKGWTHEFKNNSRGKETKREQDYDPQGYLKALNVNRSSLSGLTEDEIKHKLRSNYRQAAFSSHPDRGGSNEAMRKVNQAYEVMSKPNLRREYFAQSVQRPGAK